MSINGYCQYALEFELLGGKLNGDNDMFYVKRCSLIV